MSIINKIKFHAYKWIAILGAVGMLALSIYYTFRTVPKAKRTIGVQASAEYEKPTATAVGIWNDFVGCEFLVIRDDLVSVSIRAEDGEPCGEMWRPEDEWGHAATAYHCKNITMKHEEHTWHPSEILISQPGTIWMQAWTIGHEIGHTLKEYGVEHHSIGIMAKTPLDDGGKSRMITIRDRDAKALNKEFCK